MMHVYAARDGALEKVECDRVGLPEGGVWIDLNHPTHEEEKLLESLTGIDIPTREEMQEIEASSRLYEENDALYMTALVVWRADTHQPANTPVTFIVTPRHLITVRYADPLPFKNFLVRCSKQPRTVGSSDTAFVSLLEAIVDRSADLLERIGAELDAISAEIFRTHNDKAARERSPSRKSADLEMVITRIGRTTISRPSCARASSASAASSLSSARPRMTGSSRRCAVISKTVDRDVRSLNEHDAYLVHKVNFLLDATLGLITSSRTASSRFSVAAVVLMPPTLRRQHLRHELRHILARVRSRLSDGVLIMICSAALLLYFKHRNWL